MSELTVDASIPRYPPCDELERERIKVVRFMKAENIKRVEHGGGKYPQRSTNEQTTT